MHVPPWVFVARDVNWNTHLWSPIQKYNIIHMCKKTCTRCGHCTNKHTGFYGPEPTSLNALFAKIPPMAGFFIVSTVSFHLTKNLFSSATRAPGHLFYYQNAPAQHQTHVEQMARDDQIPEFSFYCRNISILHF